ncbi:hypothetical protein K523DRAFT_337858 [Schizophyllum commune Tattone D]|nr:hypothetical protein K523DRAFT_337858 [Schizophyllum commune Tattone D]
MPLMTHDIDTFATTAAGQYQHFIQFCIQWSSIALLYYDYSLTLADERKLIWSQTLGVTTVLYVLCRYALVANVLYLLAISHLIVEYALPIPLAVLVLIFRLAAMPRTLASRHSVPGQHERGSSGIASQSSYSSSVLSSSGVRLSIASAAVRSYTVLGDKALSIMVVVFEFISTTLMAYRCFPAVREQRRMRAAGAFQRPLLVAVFQQGYFFSGSRPPLVLSISGLLTARFILHLRTIAGQDVIKSHVEPDESVVMSRMDFNDQNATQASYVSQSRTFGDAEERDEAAAGTAAEGGPGEDHPRSPTFPACEDKKGKGKSVSSIPTVV